MMNLVIKVGIAVVIPTALSVAAFYLSSITDGGHAQFLDCMGTTLTVAAAVTGVITWAVHRIYQLDRKFQEFQRDVKARLFIMDLDDDDPLFRAIFHHPEDS